MRSSYIEHHYGNVLKTTVVGLKPTSFVELGVLDGYSTLHIARGLQEIDRLYGIKAVLDAYDLFGTYEFKHGDQAEVQAMLEREGVAQYVKLIQGDAYEAYQHYDDGRVEFLHVDISNTGETVRRIMEQWHSKICGRGVILFEGGSEERDQVEWMTKYGKEPIKPELDRNPFIKERYMRGTYFPFPSMTMLFKAWG